ncbi:retrovirus-related pol polyprotein from transposon TNT 1-94 [Tanacetum coccineum]
MEKINNFQQEPDETLYQAWERFEELLMKCPQHYLTKMQEVILFYNGLDVPTRQILDSKGAIPSKTSADAKVAIQKWSNTLKNDTMEHLGQEVLKLLADWQPYKHNLIILKEKSRRYYWKEDLEAYLALLKLTREIMSKKKGSYGPQFSEAYSYGASHIDNSIPRKEKDPGSFTLPCYINNVCLDNALADLGASVSVMPLSTYLNLGLGELAHTKLIVELADRTVKYPKGIAENVLVGIGKFVFPVDFIILDMPEDVKVPLILERPFLSIAHAKIDVFKRKITLRVGDEKIIFKSVKPASSLIKRVYMLSLRKRMELDLEARLMGETLVLNRSLDNLYEDYIELNDLIVPLEIKRNQVDDLMPTIKEGEVIDEPMIDIIKTRNNESFDEKFSVVNHFAVVENMDGYRDQDIGDIILGEPFCKASCVEARRFDGLIIIHNGSDNVTYQMTRSHPRFKHLSNAQCNKIKLLLKVSQYGVFQFMDTAYWSPVQFDLAAKKSTKLVKYRSSGILCVL